MSHYEQRLQADLDALYQAISDVSAQIEHALVQAHKALMTDDDELAYQTILGDLPINRAIRAIDAQCHRFIALHLPSAGHLRFISSVYRLTIALERIGDYAVTICREAVQLPKPARGIIRQEIELLAEDAIGMYQQAMNAFLSKSADAARATMKVADRVQRALDTAFQNLVNRGYDEGYELKDLFALLVILNRWERVSDQSKNICEDAIFTITGETKKPKVYRILFLDRDNADRAILAEAVARKAFPASGSYRSAASSPVATLPPKLTDFLAARGHDVDKLGPSDIDWPVEDWSNFHVVVSLDGPVTDYIAPVPFQTVALEWDLEVPDETTDPTDRYTHLYRTISTHVRQLMETLHGPDAA